VPLRGKWRLKFLYAHEIATEIHIAAPAQRIWDILTDFPRYPEWNRFLLKINGRAANGAWIRFLFEMPRGFRAPACATVLKLDPGKELRWAGGIHGLFRAEHYFVIEPGADPMLRFRHGEIFTGLLVPIVWRLLLERGGPPVYQAMNVSLKERAEQVAPAQ